MGLSTYHGIALVQNKGRGIDVDTFESRLHVVKGIIENGAIGDGCYGSDEHLKALVEVEKHITFVRQRIEVFNSEPQERD